MNDQERIFNEKFSEKLTSARKKKGLSQIQLSTELGISATRLNYWEKGKAKPDIHILKKIALFLNTTPAELLGFNEIWEEFDRKYNVEKIANDVNKLECFTDYLESLGYSVFISQDSETSYSAELQKNTITSKFTQSEFEVLQEKSKEQIEGAFLLQHQKNKQQKPPSDDSENGSN